MIDNEPQQTTDTFLAATLERIRQRSQAHREQWDTWATGQPQSTTCEEHQSVRSIDFERSLYESSRQKQNVMVYDDCLECVELAKSRAQARWMLDRGVPDNMLHASFDTYQPKTDRQGLAAEHGRKFAQRRKGFWILTGATKGTGKTHLAVAVMRAMGCGRFLTNTTLMQKISKRYDDRAAEDVIDNCQRAKLLILDDLGISRGGKDELPALHSILEHRHGAKLPTVLTSNLSPDAVQNYLGERLGDRLHESCFACEVIDGDSYRQQAKANYFA